MIKNKKDIFHGLNFMKFIIVNIVQVIYKKQRKWIIKFNECSPKNFTIENYK